MTKPKAIPHFIVIRDETCQTHTGQEPNAQGRRKAAVKEEPTHKEEESCQRKMQRKETETKVTQSILSEKATRGSWP